MFVFCTCFSITKKEWRGRKVGSKRKRKKKKKERKKKEEEEEGKEKRGRRRRKRKERKKKKMGVSSWILTPRQPYRVT